METREYTVYKFKELPEKSKEKAIEWMRECNYQVATADDNHTKRIRND